MADINDKQYSLLKENLENMGNGADKFQTTPDPEHPLPPNITKARYDASVLDLKTKWEKMEASLTKYRQDSDAFQASFKKADGLYSTDVRAIKGVFGIYSENLRDFGVKPEKKRQGRPKKLKTS